MRRFVLFLLVCVSCVAYSQTKLTKAKTKVVSKVSQDQSGGRKELTKHLEPPITRADVQALLDEQEAKRNQKDASEDTAIQRHIMTFTGALTVIGGIQVIGLIITLFITKQAADAATLSANSAKTTLETVERGVLHFDGVNLVGAILSPESLIHVNYRNGGRTPCVLKSLMIKRGVLPLLPETPDLSGKESRNDYMASDRSRHNVSTLDLTEQNVEDILSGKVKLFVYGLFEYEDTFGRAHATGFCEEWIPTLSKFASVALPQYSYAN